MTLTAVLPTIAGLGVLAAGGELLVRGASGIAAAAGGSRLVIGPTIVSVGKSAPEMLVSVYASVTGNPDVAAANVVGSNIFDILGILGVSGLVAPLPLAVHASVVDFDLQVMIAVAAACLCPSPGTT